MPPKAKRKVDSNYSVWDKSVPLVSWNRLDPMIGDSPVISRDTRIASIGCCFSQRMAHFLKTAGYEYYVAEPGGMGDELFSARYGNVNTARQAVQLVKRAYGEMSFPEEIGVWRLKENDLFVDAFRPAFADAWPTKGEVKADRERHFAFVRKVIEDAEVMLYTTGVTECWLSRSFGAVFPIAPGMMNRDFDVKDMLFHNFSVSETVRDLNEFIDACRKRNPGLKFIVAVSPLSMVATFDQKKHVLLSNYRSKSVLRAALDEVCASRKDVYYFPVLEILSGHQTYGKLYQRNLRLVTDAGVNMAMRCFLRHFTVEGNTVETAAYAVPTSYGNVICDPELLMREEKNSNT